SRYKFLMADRERPILEPKEIFLGAEAFFTCAKPHGRWTIAKDAAAGASEVSAPIPDIAVNRRLDDPLANLRAFLAGTDAKVMICADSPGRRETLQQYFNEYKLDLAAVEGYQGLCASSAKAMLGVAPLQAGFELM